MAINTFDIVDTSTDAAGTSRRYTFGKGGGGLESWKRSLLTKFERGNPFNTVATIGGGSDNFVYWTDVVTADGTSSYETDVEQWTEYETRLEERPLKRTDPQSGVRNLRVRTYPSKPLFETDEITRTWKSFYDSNDRLTHFVPPEGTESGGLISAGYTQNTYDSRGNVTQVTRVKKSGSPLADIVTTAGFPATCSNPKTCNRPTWTKDANGQQTGLRTDYTYDCDPGASCQGHGGILTELKPSVTIGTPGSAVTARPLTVTAWTQRNAWVKNASNQLVQHSDPVWLISTVTECQGSPGSNTPVCDSSKPQTVTTYEYGATGTRESLLVKGVAVASGGVTLRTCYGYDVFNRRISETKPNADQQPPCP